MKIAEEILVSTLCDSLNGIAQISRREARIALEDVTEFLLEGIAKQIDYEWISKSGLNCTEVCAIIRSKKVYAQ